jgi:hypothetical protein
MNIPNKAWFGSIRRDFVGIVLLHDGVSVQHGPQVSGRSVVPELSRPVFDAPLQLRDGIGGRPGRVLNRGMKGRVDERVTQLSRACRHACGIDSARGGAADDGERTWRSRRKQTRDGSQHAYLICRTGAAAGQYQAGGRLLRDIDGSHHGSDPVGGAATESARAGAPPLCGRQCSSQRTGRRRHGHKWNSGASS